MFLAVPITAAIKITLENVPGVRAIGILMGTGNYKPRKGDPEPFEGEMSDSDTKE